MQITGAGTVDYSYGVNSITETSRWIKTLPNTKL